MPDERTQHALDALADLFLTGVGPKQVPGQGTADAPSPAPANASAGHRDATMLEGPAPIRLAPKLRRASSASSDFTAADAIPPRGAAPRADSALLDEMTAWNAPSIPPAAQPGAPSTPGDAPFLRLRRDDHPISTEQARGTPGPGPAASPSGAPDHDPESRDDPSTDRPDDDIARRGVRSRRSRSGRDGDDPVIVQVEAVMLGNLPGMGGPWLAQYAQLLAQQAGPVAVLRVSDEQIDLELVEPGDRRGDLDLDRFDADGHDRPDNETVSAPTGGLVGLLDALVRRPAVGGRSVRTVLVSLDSSVAEPGLSRLGSLDRWTVVCGADDAAIAGMDQTLSRLADADEALAAKRVGVMIMGSDEPASRSAAKRMESALASRFDTPVRLVGWQKRMAPVTLRLLGSFMDVDAIWPDLARWFEALQAPPMTEVEPPDRQASPQAGGRAADRGTSAPWDSAAGATSARESDRPTSDHAAEAARPGTIKQAGTTRDEVDLTRLISTGPGGVPGGVALEARCPHHRHTQLMLDQQGRLHLLYHAPVLAQSAGDPGLDALRAAIVDLLQARKWVDEHLDLLQLTQRQVRIDPHATPVLHLFTDRADLATGLVARLGDTLRLHLLQQISVGDHQTWFCTALG